MDWSTEEVFKIIALYRQFACLWDYKSPKYKRLDKKKNAWAEIANNMNRNEDFVKNKIKNLRSAYYLENKKVATSKNLVPALMLYTNFICSTSLKWNFWIKQSKKEKPAVTLKNLKS